MVAGGTQDGINLAGANALALTAAFDKVMVTGNAAAGITSGGTLPVYATVSRSTVRGNGGTGIFVANGATASVTRVTQIDDRPQRHRRRDGRRRDDPVPRQQHARGEQRRRQLQCNLLGQMNA